jgi:diguanylate cyclase (GGDEF)-like protein
MFYWLDAGFADKPFWQIALSSVALILLLGAIDAMTGYEISFSIFYLLPISLAAWYGTGGMTAFASTLATLVWMAVEYWTHEPYSQQWILLWNSGVRLLFFLIVAYLIRELRSHVDLQQQLARTDPLTGLLNRSGFMERSEALVNSASRYGLSLAIGYIDLDGFKYINDTLGHSRGDEVLRAIGGVLRLSSRESDVAGRIGGDEFAVLLPNTDLEGAGVFFEKLRVQILADVKKNGWSQLGVSIGAIVFEKGPPSLSDALIFADHLMYRAKKSDGTSVIVEPA